MATVLLLGVCNLICYADRVNIGVAILPMKAELGMDKSTEAMVLSSFFWGCVLSHACPYVCMRAHVTWLALSDGIPLSLRACAST